MRNFEGAGAFWLKLTHHQGVDLPDILLFEKSTGRDHGNGICVPITSRVRV
jgi:hypothetical protein